MVLLTYLGSSLQPKSIIILCLLNFICLVVVYSLLLTYVQRTATFDNIIYQEMEKIMDPNLLTVEQMAIAILQYTGKDSDSRLSRRWSKTNCKSSEDNKLAIVVPYRDRKIQLKVFTKHIHRILSHQQMCYHLYVVEQNGDGKFNKGVIMNAGFLEAMKHWRFDCIMFHDVDLIPENNNISYSCSAQPIHVSVSIDKFDYKLPYSYLVGGVILMKTQHFLMLNGYSNMYWDWGAEDDDLYIRIRATNLTIIRPNPSVAKFRMLKHKSRPKSPIELRHKLLSLSKARYRLDGLNSISYTLLKKSYLEQYTHLLVDVGPSPF